MLSLRSQINQVISSRNSSSYNGDGIIEADQCGDIVNLRVNINRLKERLGLEGRRVIGPVKYTATGWRDCDYEGTIPEGADTYAAADVKILGDYLGSYPLYSTTARETMGMLFMISDVYVVELYDFYQFCYVKCTDDGTPNEFSEIELDKTLITNGRVYASCVLLGDSAGTWQLDDTAGSENIGYHILFDDGGSWAHGILQIVAPTYAYFYPDTGS